MKISANEEEKQNCIKSWEEDIEDLDILVYKIKNENFIPIIELQLWPDIWMLFDRLFNS